MEMRERIRRNWRWLLVAAGTVAPLAFPLPDVYRLFLCITLWAILIWAFDLVNSAVVAVVLPVLYIVFRRERRGHGIQRVVVHLRVDHPGGSASGHGFHAQRFGAAIGVQDALGHLRRLQGEWVLAISLTCLIITPVIPSVMGKIVLMVPIVVEVCNALGLKKGSNGAAALILVVFFALWSPKMAFPTASTDAILATGILVDQYHYDITWLEWAKDMFVPAILWTAVSVCLVWLLKPGKVELDRFESVERYRALGPMSGQEKKLTVMMAAVVALLATQGLHGVDPAYVLVIAAAVCFMPQAGILEASDFKKTDLSVVFFLAGAVSIGAVASQIGITSDVVAGIQPALEGRSNFVLVMFLYMFAVATNFLLNPMALIATLLGPVTELCMQLGYSPVLGGYSMIMGFNQALLPYEIAPFMLVYSYGYLKMGPTMRVMAVRIGAGIVFTVVVTYPYWCLIGLV